MSDHVTSRVSSRGGSERFYGAVLRTLGIEGTYGGDDDADGTNVEVVSHTRP